MNKEDKKWAIHFYRDLAEEAEDLGRPDLAVRAIKCAKNLMHSSKKGKTKQKTRT